jgi:ubiquitin C-terminal hydrolase
MSGISSSDGHQKIGFHFESANASLKIDGQKVNLDGDKDFMVVTGKDGNLKTIEGFLAKNGTFFQVKKGQQGGVDIIVRGSPEQLTSYNFRVKNGSVTKAKYGEDRFIPKEKPPASSFEIKAGTTQEEILKQFKLTSKKVPETTESVNYGLDNSGVDCYLNSSSQLIRGMGTYYRDALNNAVVTQEQKVKELQELLANLEKVTNEDDIIEWKQQIDQAKQALQAAERDLEDRRIFHSQAKNSIESFINGKRPNPREFRKNLLNGIQAVNNPNSHTDFAHTNGVSNKQNDAAELIQKLLQLSGVEGPELQSTLTTKKDGNSKRTVTKEKQSMLNLEIILGDSQSISLQDCLEKFLSEEVMDTAGVCVQETNDKADSASRQYNIINDPEHLVVSLKRFTNDRKKINEEVDVMKSLTVNDHSYKPVSIVCHLGREISSGHYVTYQNDRGTWRLINDDKVTLVHDMKSDSGFGDNHNLISHEDFIKRNAYVIDLKKLDRVFMDITDSTEHEVVSDEIGSPVTVRRKGREELDDNRYDNVANGASVRTGLKAAWDIAKFFTRSQAPEAPPTFTIQLPGESRSVDIRHSILPRSVLNSLSQEEAQTLIQEKVHAGSLKMKEVMEGMVELDSTGKTAPASKEDVSNLMFFLHVSGEAQAGASFSEGAFNIPDPEGHLHKYLDSSRDAYQRVSSHTEGFQAAEGGKHRGIDFEGGARNPGELLPYDMGSLLYGKLGTERLGNGAGGSMPGMPEQRIFLKNESHGAFLFPPRNRDDPGPDRGWKARDWSQAVGHALSYLATRGGGSAEGTRKERIPDTVKNEFRALTRDSTLPDDIKTILQGDNPTDNSMGIRIMNRNAATALNEAKSTGQPYETIEKLKTFIDTLGRNYNHLDVRIGNEVILDLTQLGITS